MHWMLMPLRRFFDFRGRSRRKEYWMFFLFGILVGFAASILDTMMGYGSVETYSGSDGFNLAFESHGPVGVIAFLALLIPGIAVAVRRLHDLDRSGWWLLLIFVPLLGWLVLLIFLLTDGSRGTNRFGPDPKSPAGDDIEKVFS